MTNTNNAAELTRLAKAAKAARRKVKKLAKVSMWATDFVAPEAIFAAREAVTAAEDAFWDAAKLAIRAGDIGPEGAAALIG